MQRHTGGSRDTIARSKQRFWENVRQANDRSRMCQRGRMVECRWNVKYAGALDRAGELVCCSRRAWLMRASAQPQYLSFVKAMEELLGRGYRGAGGLQRSGRFRSLTMHDAMSCGFVAWAARVELCTATFYRSTHWRWNAR